MLITGEVDLRSHHLAQTISNRVSQWTIATAYPLYILSRNSIQNVDLHVSIFVIRLISVTVLP